MTLGETFLAVWQQAMVEEKHSVELSGKTYAVRKTRSKGLRTVEFDYEGHHLTGIEQNPQTASRWAELARQGQRVMQFSFQGRYIANVCESKLMRYPAWQALQLPQ
jgi:hypothetical protein